MGNEERNIRLVYFYLLFVFSNDAFAQFSKSLLSAENPLFEIGAGIIHLNVPDYPGSSGSRNIVLPFPAAIYRGRRLRADEDGGLYGKFIDSNKFQLNISIAANFSSGSDDNPARQGMPRLDGLLEVGPSLIYFLKKATTNSKYKINLTIPFRVAYSSDFKSIDNRGATFHPSVLMLKEECGFKNTFCFINIDTKFATTEYMAYYYDVQPQYANSERAAYKSKGGYLSSGIALILSHNFFKKLNFFYGGFANTYRDSKNKSSPLLVVNENYGYVIGVTYWFYESKLKENSLF